MGGHRVALISLVAALTAPTPRARAQAPAAGGEIEMEPEAARAEAAPSDAAPAPDPKAARKWLVAGQQLMRKAGYLAARNRRDDAKAQLVQASAAFRRSLDASDDPNVRFELALADDQLGKLDEAVRELRVVVAAQAALRPEVARKATRKLAELSAQVAVVTLTVAPAGASVTLGGIELGTAPLREPLVLMPGTYTLSFVAEGYQPKEAEITVEPGTETEHAIELDAVRVIVKPVEPIVLPVVAEAPPPPPPRSRLPLIVGAGITVAAASGATVLGILARARHATFVDPTTSPGDRDDARDQGKRLALGADLAIGTAVVAAGFTASWYFFKYRQRRDKREHRHLPAVDAKLDVAPWVQSQSGGVTIAGWF